MFFVSCVESDIMCKKIKRHSSQWTWTGDTLAIVWASSVNQVKRVEDESAIQPCEENVLV